MIGVEVLSMSRSIRSYLPQDHDLSDQLNVKMPPELKRRVKEIAKHNRWTPSQVVRACLHKFIDDEQTEPRPHESFKLPKQIDFLAEAPSDAKFGARVK